jgi:N-acetyl-1-D-myo-inositol-2-amino-2-deoxy-alpha-D-glucopyranoside deacetylase
VASIDEEVADLAAVLDAVRPDLVVGYGPDGGYGHPDHIRAHHVAAAAARSAGIEFAELAHAPGPDVEWFDLEAHRDRVSSALLHHRSQLTVDGRDLVHSGGQRQAIEPSVGLRRSAG